jgi:hypothetical protein
MSPKIHARVFRFSSSWSTLDLWFVPRIQIFEFSGFCNFQQVRSLHCSSYNLATTLTSNRHTCNFLAKCCLILIRIIQVQMGREQVRNPKSNATTAYNALNIYHGAINGPWMVLGKGNLMNQSYGCRVQVGHYRIRVTEKTQISEIKTADGRSIYAPLVCEKSPT